MAKSKDDQAGSTRVDPANQPQTDTHKMNDPVQLNHFAIEDIELEPNPRPAHKIKPEAIDEMAESILEHGIIQPPIGRMVDGRPRLYIGQRRYYGLRRALQLAEERALPAETVAKLLKIPLLVRVIDDRSMLEQQWIENLQREDVTARDEAEGFDFMQRTLGYSLEEIGAKIGKTKAYVSNRLKLMKAPDSLWKAFEEGRVGTRHLELVGGIPHPKDREEAAKAILKPSYQDKPLTVLEATEMIGERYVVSLRACGFDKGDADLVKVQWRDGVRSLGGACVDCPFLSKNDPTLAGSLGGAVGNKGGVAREGGASGGVRGIDPNLCLNPTCYKAKQDAAWEAVKEQAAANGKRIMDVDQTSKLFNEWGTMQVKTTVGLIDLAGQPGYEETGHHGEDVPDWEELLKGTTAKKEGIMARHPKTNRVVFLLERERAIELAIENDPDHKKIFENRPQKSAKKPKAAPVEVDAEPHDDQGEESEEVAVTDEASAAAAADTDTDAQGRSISQVIDEEKVASMGVLVRALRDGDSAINALAEQLVMARLAFTTLPAKHLLCAAVVDEDCEIILGWSHDACTRVLMDSDADVIDLLLLAELAQALVRGDAMVIRELQKLANHETQSESPSSGEQLYDCAKCGGKGFTKRGLSAHKCEKRQEKAKARAPEAAAADDWEAQWEALPPKPKKDSPDYKPWDALRKKIKYHAERAGITLKAKNE